MSQIVEHPDPTYTDPPGGRPGDRRLQAVLDAVIGADARGGAAAQRRRPTRIPMRRSRRVPRRSGSPTSAPLFAHSDSRFSLPYDGISVQAQQANRLRRHQLLIGGDYTRRQKRFRCHDFVTSSVYTGQHDRRRRRQCDAKPPRPPGSATTSKSRRGFTRPSAPAMWTATTGTRQGGPTTISSG